MVIPKAFITMSMRETDRLKTIYAVVDRMARAGQAAQQLGLSLTGRLSFTDRKPLVD